MKKSTVRSIGIGSLVLTAIAAGAWFMLYSETAQEKEIVSAPSPSPSQFTRQETQQQEIKAPLEENTSPYSDEQQNPPSEFTQEIIPAPHDLPAENSPEETTAEELDQSTSIEDAEKTEANTSLESSKSNTSDQNESKEKAQAGHSPLPEEQSQSETLSDQQVDKKISSRPSCTEVSPTLSNFFNKLEKKQYSKEANSTQPLQEHFNDLTTQLMNNPPVVAHETDELYTLLTNTAHFFRILGKDNMRLLQKVIKQEHADFEKIAAEIYRLSLTGEECVSGEKKLEIPFTSAYEYAGFFLNTLGGRSYLFRRDPGTRLLVNYYAILILDQANQKDLNIYGVDMTEHLPWLIQEMEASNRLTSKEGYLDKLYELAENYQALP